MAIFIQMLHKNLSSTAIQIRFVFVCKYYREKHISLYNNKTHRFNHFRRRKVEKKTRANNLSKHKQVLNLITLQVAVTMD